jgi:isopentenyl-diphosphate delta-isomerase
MFNIPDRKSEHLKICLKEDVSFTDKTNGFENYDFPHFASSENDYKKIDTVLTFFDKKINFPFLISCMTGGTKEAERINEKLAVVASELNIPIGVGSQRQALENSEYLSTYKIIRKNAGEVPIIANLGANQVAKSKNIISDVNKVVDMVEADALAVHINLLQELFQKEGDADFSGLKKSVEKICSKISVPVFIKEVGSGISKKVAKSFLEIGVKGIDVAGAGGTSWAKVEMLRNGNIDDFFANWGLPTSYCVRKIAKLKKQYDFVLISSGGINHYSDIAKSLVLGADISASARIILQELMINGVEGLLDFLNLWFENIKKIMFLTNCKSLEEFHNIRLIKKEKLF